MIAYVTKQEAMPHYIRSTNCYDNHESSDSLSTELLKPNIRIAHIVGPSPTPSRKWVGRQKQGT